MSTSRIRRLMVIIGHDAYLKGARNICALMAQQGPIEVEWFTTSKQLVSSQLRWFNIDLLLDDGWSQIYPCLLKVDQIIAELGGRDINRLIYAVHNAKARTASTQPLIVTSLAYCIYASLNH